MVVMLVVYDGVPSLYRLVARIALLNEVKLTPPNYIYCLFPKPDGAHQEPVSAPHPHLPRGRVCQQHGCLGVPQGSIRGTPT